MMTERDGGQKPANKVKVVVPIYHSVLDDMERRSLLHNLGVLSRYPVLFLLPDDIAAPPPETEGFDIQRVSSEWLGAKNGIAGYNRMMMSREFYEMFSDCEYILVCQTDVWVFRDELEEWCDRGFDYVGAPWLRRPLYDLLPVRVWLALRRRFCRGPLRQDMFNRVGNGGFSLRRVASHREMCVRYASVIEEFNRHTHHLYNEDRFWASVPDPAEFRYPTVAEALGFSFDVRPGYCYRLTGGRLPMGCHGWYKKRLYRFWKKIIPAAGSDL